MKFQKTKLPDVVIIEPVVYEDDRGYFIETFRKDLFENFLGFEVPFCQDNESMSDKGVLRGLHYQLPPVAQSKLVRVIKGKVLDIAVDIRKGSPTFSQYVAVELSGKNKRQLFIPRGFAHAFVVLEDETIFSYKVDNYYSPKYNRGIAFDDPYIGINWPLKMESLKLSEKDLKQPRLLESNLFEYGKDYYE